MDLLLNEATSVNPVDSVLVSVSLEDSSAAADNESLLIDSSTGMVQMLAPPGDDAITIATTAGTFATNEKSSTSLSSMNDAVIKKGDEENQSQFYTSHLNDGTLTFYVTKNGHDNDPIEYRYIVDNSNNVTPVPVSLGTQMMDDLMDMNEQSSKLHITHTSNSDKSKESQKLDDSDDPATSGPFLDGPDGKTTLNALSTQTIKNKKSELLVCKSCGQFFATLSQLKLHDRSHSGGKIFTCGTCSKAFGTSYALKNHIRVHTGERPYLCTSGSCKKAFKTSGDLQKHIRTHTGERPFVCPFEGCKASFTTSNIRKVHIRRHTGEKPYTCDVVDCGKSFASATNYKNHQRIHTGEKPYVCNVTDCGKKFTEYSSLYKHHTVHSRQKPYECSMCHKSYCQPSTLANHRKTVHGDSNLISYDTGLSKNISYLQSRYVTQPNTRTTLLAQNNIKQPHQVLVNANPDTVLRTPSTDSQSNVSNMTHPPTTDDQSPAAVSEDEEGVLVINTMENTQAPEPSKSTDNEAIDTNSSSRVSVMTAEPSITKPSVINLNDREGLNDNKIINTDNGTTVLESVPFAFQLPIMAQSDSLQVTNVPQVYVITDEELRSIQEMTANNSSGNSLPIISISNINT